MGADTKCQERADAAGLGGQWKAWLSDSVTSAASRLVHSDIPYQRLDGLTVADNWADLTDGALQNPINRTELGIAVSRNPWTHTLTNGNRSLSIGHCSSWTGTSGGGDYGNTDSINSSWTEGDGSSSFCWISNPLFCFEQISGPPTPTPTTLPPNIPNDLYYFSRGSWGQAYDDLWGLKKINAKGAWEQTKGSGDIVVADIDTGVDRNHEDIVGNMWTNPNEIPNNSIDDDGNGYIDDYYGCNFINMVGNVCGDPMDDNGHGTHTAGTIGAVGNNGIGVVGVNWTVKIMALKFLDRDGGGSTSDAIKALQYADDMRAKVSNNSWGGFGPDVALDDAIKYAHDKGMVTVVVAGNDNWDALDFHPADSDYAITIAASDANDLKASFSNWGEKIDVAAPGVDILSLRALGTDLYEDGLHFVPDGDPNAKYYRANGTSMATPHVAGLAALLLSKNPNLTNEDVRQILRRSATDLGDVGKDRDYGYGRIDTYQALANANTKPLDTLITSPSSRTSIQGGNVQIIGSAFGANFSSYKVEIGPGRSPSEWTTLVDTTVQVNNGILATLDTLQFSDGLYSIRLTTTDTLGNTYQFQIHDLIINNIFVDAEGDVGEFSSIAIATDGFPVISYYDITARDLNVAKCINTFCSTNTPPTLTILNPDLSNNGLVDQADVDILSAAFLAQKGDPKYKVEYDLKPDGVINISDFGIISVNSGLSWPPNNLKEGGTLKFYVIGSDPDGDSLTLSASSMPSGATFDPSTGLFSWAPTFYQAGSYSPIFTVSDGSLDDSETLPITVIDVPSPDLLISSVSTATTVMYPGSNISVPNSLLNQGTASATSSAIAFHLSTDATYGGTDDIAFVNTRTVSSLAAGATSSVTTWTMAIPSTTPIGTYYICAMADSGQTVTEENETNNSRCTTSTIKVAFPDILVTALSGPTSAVTGSSISLSTTIVNQGEGPSKSVNIGYYLSTDATITTSDTRILTIGFASGFAPGATRTATYYPSIPPTLNSGTYYFGTIADYQNQARENNETNNSFTGNTILVNQ